MQKTHTITDGVVGSWCGLFLGAKAAFTRQIRLQPRYFPDIMKKVTPKKRIRHRKNDPSPYDLVAMVRENDPNRITHFINIDK